MTPAPAVVAKNTNTAAGGEEGGSLDAQVLANCGRCEELDYGV